MFTIEHDFDATVVTLVDERREFLREDVVINAFDDCVTIEQWDPQEDRVHKITLSISQLKDLAVALDLPECIYQRARPGDVQEKGGQGGEPD